MSDDPVYADIDLTPTRNPGIQTNPSQNVKGEVDPHAHEENVKLEYLHPDLSSLDKVINAANYQRRVARHTYGDQTGRMIYTALLYWEEVLQNSEDPQEQLYLKHVQALLHHHKKQIAFQDELITLINKHCMEDASNTPDHLLADYLIRCLQTWDDATKARENWYKGQP
jgi:hypothetical protein